MKKINIGKRIMSLIMLIIMVFTLVPSETLAQTGFTITNSTNDLGVNYANIYPRIGTGSATFSSTNSALKVDHNNFVFYDTSSNTERQYDTTLYYEGKLNWGTANRTSTADAVLGVTTVPGTATFRMTNGASLADGTKADILITFKDIKIAVGAIPEGANPNATVKVPLAYSSTETSIMMHVATHPRTGNARTTCLQTSFGVEETVTITLVKTGTNTPIDESQYPTVLFAMRDLDIPDYTKASGNTPAQNCAGRYAESCALVSGFQTKLYKTASTQTVNDTVDGSTRIRGLTGDDDEMTMDTGFIATASTQGFTYTWRASRPSTGQDGAMTGTTFNYLPNVSVKAAAGTGGSIEKAGEKSYIINSKTLYKYTPSEGYKVKSLKVDGSAVTFNKAGGVYTFDKVTETNPNGVDHTIDVQFEKKDYTVTYTSDEGGNITGKTEEYRDPNENPSGTTQEDKDMYRLSHYISDVPVTLKDGTSIPAGSPITPDQIPNVVVNQDIEFTAIHDKLFNINYVAEEGGQITGKATEIRSEKENPTGSSAEAMDGYQFLFWTDEEGNVVTMDEIMEMPIDRDRTFTAVFELIPSVNAEKTADKESYNVDEDIVYTIRVKQSVDGATAKDVKIVDSLPEGVSIVSEVMVSGIENYEVMLDTDTIGVLIPELKDEEVEITFTARADKEIVMTSELLNTVSAEISNGDKPEDSSITVGRTVKVTTEITNGEITPTEENIPVGSDRTITYTPNEGYMVSHVYVNGVEAEAPEDYTFTNLVDNNDISVVCERIPYEIVTEVINGTIEGGGTVLWSDDCKVTFTPSEGYMLKSVMVDGELVEADTEYLFENITSDHYIVVEYERIPYEITTEAENGVISDGDTVLFGEDFDVTYSPNEDYELKKIEIDGEEAELQDSYTFRDVRANHHFKAIFGLKKFNITTNVVGGSITEDRVVTIGDDQRIVFAPEDGYELSKIIIDGEEIDITGLEEDYMFKNMRGNHEITVIYEKIPEPEVPKFTVTFMDGDKVLKVEENIPMHGKANGFTPEKVGYIFKGWDKEFDDITGDLIVTAIWEEEPIVTPPAYIIRTEVVNGEIDPMVGVIEGNSITVNFKANEGYILKEIIVDGVSIELNGQTSYEFSEVTSDHSIKVVYEEVEEPEKPKEPKETPEKEVVAKEPENPKTGDQTNAVPYIALGLMSMLGCVILRHKKRWKGIEV